MESLLRAPFTTLRSTLIMIFIRSKKGRLRIEIRQACIPKDTRIIIIKGRQIIMHRDIHKTIRKDKQIIQQKCFKSRLNIIRNANLAELES